MRNPTIGFLCLLLSAVGRRVHFAPSQSTAFLGYRIPSRAALGRSDSAFGLRMITPCQARGPGSENHREGGILAKNFALEQQVNSKTDTNRRSENMTIEVLKTPGLHDKKVVVDFLVDNLYDHDLNALQSLALLPGPLQEMSLMSLQQRHAVKDFFAASLKEQVASDEPFSLVLLKENGEIIGEAWLGCRMYNFRTDAIRPLTLEEARICTRGLAKGGYEKIVAYITNLAVRKDRRGRGLGRELMAIVERQAAAWGCSALHLHVDLKNSVARNLYESATYKVVSEDQERIVMVPSSQLLNFEKCATLHMRKDIQHLSGSTTL